MMNISFSSSTLPEAAEGIAQGIPDPPLPARRFRLSGDPLGARPAAASQSRVDQLARKVRIELLGAEA
jgi:hypothetical protein